MKSLEIEKRLLSALKQSVGGSSKGLPPPSNTTPMKRIPRRSGPVTSHAVVDSDSEEDEGWKAKRLKPTPTESGPPRRRLRGNAESEEEEEVSSDELSNHHKQPPAKQKEATPTGV